VKYKQQAHSLLSINNYTPLVISGNDKNKQLTLLSQCKLALAARNTFFHNTIIGAPKKLEKLPHPLFAPRTNQ
jgi:hypothetical protein